MDNQDALIRATTAVGDTLAHLQMDSDTKVLALIANVAHLLRKEYAWTTQRRLEAGKLADCLLREAMRDERSAA